MNIAGNPRGLSIKPLNPRAGGDEKFFDGDSSAASAALELSFFATPPNYELSLDEFEELALARLKVLRKIEELKTRNITGINFSTALDKTIGENLKSIPSMSMDMNSTMASSSSSARKASVLRQLRKKRDVASHFILRAAYCKTEDLRRWFLSQETFLFKYRLEKIASSSSSSGGQDALRRFLKENDLHFEIVSEDEKQTVKPFLLQIPIHSYNNNTNSDSMSLSKLPSANEVNSTTYFKIHFSEAADLISKRQCYVSKGYAYVPLPKIVSIITARFRMTLSKSLAKASRVFGQVTNEYTPIAPLLNNMNAQYTGREYDGNNNNSLNNGEYDLTANNVDSYASSMPLCMSQLHNGLKQDSKLRHHGRLQYGLFLKGAGMSMEESLIFFQQHFTRIMSSEKFQKEYTYNIRHMYGKEGKRTSYSAYNCTKIILGSAPNGGDHHGCPYKHYGNEQLSSLLSKLKIGTAGDRDEIMNLKKEGHFNLACQKHFKVMHPNAESVRDLSTAGVGEHPNAWYAASVAYNKLKSGNSVKKEGKESATGDEKSQEN